MTLELPSKHVLLAKMNHSRKYSVYEQHCSLGLKRMLTWKCGLIPHKAGEHKKIILELKAIGKNAF